MSCNATFYAKTREDLTGQPPRVRTKLPSEYAGEQAGGTGQRRAGDGEMDELVRVSASVPSQRHGCAGDGTCDSAVLLQDMR